jgi:SagB-type dehydrogenase family enzyme
MTPLEVVLQYHQATKHHYHRFARSLGYLDWDTQPDPFRRFEGSPLIQLKLLPLDEQPLYAELFRPGMIASASVNLITISRFFRNSLAISAWKRYKEAHWSLRVNPSSGNLHPTEGYLLLGEVVPEIPSGVYHYAPREHALECRARLTSETWQKLIHGYPNGSFFVGLSSIYWREAWKYGERAFRYCQHDIGHALASLRMSAAVLGWQLIMLEELSDSNISTLLGLDRSQDFLEAEDENPELLACVIPSDQSLLPEIQFRGDDISLLSSASWTGHANRLSSSHVEWEIIDEVSRSTTKQSTLIHNLEPLPAQTNHSPIDESIVGAEKMIQQRRSAVAMDGVTSIARKTFYQMMNRVFPKSKTAPYDALSRSRMSVPRIHLALFVNRVDGLESGLYFLVRDHAKLDILKASTKSSFDWTIPPECPDRLPLFCLETGDFHLHASSASCGQDIAGDGAFSLGMIGEFEEPLRTIGPWFYRRLFWEAGLIGQILYLEAEAAGIRSTGIGCYFDDPVHGLFGFDGNQFQSLYHFTVGGPVEDSRLTTEEPYGDHSKLTKIADGIDPK